MCILGFPPTSDETFDSLVSQLRQMDPATLRMMLLWSEKLKSYYDNLDHKLGSKGHTKYIIYCVIAISVPLFIFLLWKIVALIIAVVFGGSSESSLASSIVAPSEEYNSASASDSIESEFDL